MGAVLNKKTSPLQNNLEDEDTVSGQPVLSDEDLKEIELFIRNSHEYCENAYGRTFDDEAEIESQRKEIEQGNEAVKQIKTEWGLT